MMKVGTSANRDGGTNTYPYCKKSGDSHPTAILLHTNQPADNDRNMRIGMANTKTASGIN